MDDVIIRKIRMPVQTKGTTVRDADGNYNVYINEIFSYEEQLKTYAHEIEHIEMNHFNSSYGYWVCEDQVSYE